MDCWSRLPDDVVEKFVEKLDRHSDFLSFGAVCTSWRNVFKNNIHRLPTKFPMLYCLSKGKSLPLLLQFDKENGKIHCLFGISSNKAVKLSYELNFSAAKNKMIIGSCRGWLFAIDPITHGATLINPLTGIVVRLPSFSFKPESYFYVKKVVISSDPMAGTYNCVVIFAIINYEICWCRVGDRKWNAIKYSAVIEDIIAYNGICYAIDQKSSFYRIALKESKFEMQFVVTYKPYDIIDPWSRKFLVESSGELLLIIQKKPFRIPNFHIFRFGGKYTGKRFRDELGMCEWKKIKDVGNRTIFLEDEGSLSVESSLHHGAKENCIYFIDINISPRRTGVYNLASQSVEYLSLDAEQNLLGKLWFSPNPS